MLWECEELKWRSEFPHPNLCFKSNNSKEHSIIIIVIAYYPKVLAAAYIKLNEKKVK